MFCVSLICSLFLINADAPLTDYENERMRQCLLNDAKMRELGLSALSSIFVNSRIYPEIQQQQDTENSGSEYNGEDEPDSDGHLSDDALQPDTELGCTLASLSYKDKVLVIPFFFLLIIAFNVYLPNCTFDWFFVEKEDKKKGYQGRCSEGAT